MQSQGADIGGGGQHGKQGLRQAFAAGARSRYPQASHPQPLANVGQPPLHPSPPRPPSLPSPPCLSPVVPDFRVSPFLHEMPTDRRVATPRGHMQRRVAVTVLIIQYPLTFQPPADSVADDVPRKSRSLYTRPERATPPTSRAHAHAGRFGLLRLRSHRPQYMGGSVHSAFVQTGGGVGGRRGESCDLSPSPMPPERTLTPIPLNPAQLLRIPSPVPWV